MARFHAKRLNRPELQLGKEMTERKYSRNLQNHNYHQKKKATRNNLFLCCGLDVFFFSPIARAEAVK